MNLRTGIAPGNIGTALSRIKSPSAGSQAGRVVSGICETACRPITS